MIQHEWLVLQNLSWHGYILFYPPEHSTLAWLIIKCRLKLIPVRRVQMGACYEARLKVTGTLLFTWVLSLVPIPKKIGWSIHIFKLLIRSLEFLQLFTDLSQNRTKFEKSNLSELSMKLIPKTCICCIFLSWQQEDMLLWKREQQHDRVSRHPRKDRIQFWHSARKASLLNDLIVAEDKVFPTGVEEHVSLLISFYTSNL